MSSHPSRQDTPTGRLTEELSQSVCRRPKPSDQAFFDDATVRPAHSADPNSRARS